MTSRIYIAVAALAFSGLTLRAVAQRNPTEQSQAIIDKVVKHCVEVVHQFPAHQQVDVSSNEKFFKKFDAYYNAATGRVETNNTGLVGIQNRSTSSTNVWHRKGCPSSDRIVKVPQQVPTYQQFRVEPVQPFTSGYGFNIANQHHRPLFSIVYPTAAEAEAARDAVKAALANAVEVTNYG